MATEKKIKEFNNLDEFPNLKKALIPNFKTLTLEAISTKVIIKKGKVVERIYKTPNGEIISLITNPIA